MQVHPSIREVAVLQAAAEMILAGRDADAVLHEILLIVRNYFNIPFGGVLLVDPHAPELYLHAQNGYDPDKARALRVKIGSEGVSGFVALSRTPMYIPDVSREPRYVSLHPNVRSEYCLPLIAREEVIGVLDLASDQIDYFTDDMIGLLALFANQAAVAIENARLKSNERRRMRQIEFVNLIARSSSTAGSIDQLLNTLTDLLSDTFEGAHVHILLLDRSGALNISAFSETGPPDMPAFRASARGGLIADAMSARMNVVENDVEKRAAGAHPAWTPCTPASRSEMGVPLLSLGETLGVIVLTHPMPRAFSPEDRSVAQAMADVCSTAIRNVQLADELRRVTNTDSLTGVYNHRYFHTAVALEITRAKRFGKTFYVVMTDLRGFRKLTAEKGFPAGDDVLRSLAHSLTAAVRSIDTVCRYAADRFAIILPEMAEEESVAAVRAKVEACIRELHPRGAVIATVRYPQDGLTELNLVRNLLLRLYEQKNPVAAGVGPGS
ncbi:MAG: GAF domain-containing protein [Acidobacteriales bacterium]|nr:GAF domain-containing protein [Terriglobales bacterium]